jgi:hypothetical protein
VLWLSVPDVAVMVMVYWPAGVVELFDILECPLHPVMPCINRIPTKTHPQMRSHSFLRRRSKSVRGKRSTASIAPDPTLRLLRFAGIVS